MAANEHQQTEQQDMCEPAHHARRPMNAFLIFCKRHRGSVRSGFPHLENRAVTRVLGEWWATLNPEQKRCYTNLAQEYKDAFLNANPDFKWYKLPAPPLRTLNTRPSNKKAEASSSTYSFENSKSECDEREFAETDRTDEDAIHSGKLADESQIGGLSSLFTPQKTHEPENTNGSEYAEEEDGGGDGNSVPKPPKKRYSELPLNMNNDCKADLFGDKRKNNKESNNNNQPNMNEIEKATKDASYYYDNVLDESNFRGERTCKGLRYQKFLAEQMRTATSFSQQNKKRKVGLNNSEDRPHERRNSISSNVSEKTESLSSEGNSSRSDLEHLVESAEGNLEASKPEETETESAENQLEFGSWSSRKRFRAEDFNLEKKIEALPSLSLEEFQQKKKQQRTKKKKIIQKSFARKQVIDANKSGQSLNQNNIFDLEDKDEEEHSHLVGSQKRKARKQTITRNAAAVNAAKNNDVNYPVQSNKPWCASPDLEALACLATVAANRMKLTKS